MQPLNRSTPTFSDQPFPLRCFQAADRPNTYSNRSSCAYADFQPDDTWSNTSAMTSLSSPAHVQYMNRSYGDGYSECQWQAPDQSSPTWFSIFGSNV